MPEHLGDRLLRGDKGRWLDALGAPFGWATGGFYRLPGTRWIKDILHGTWVLRHPLHPAVTDGAVGAYVVLAVLDVIYLLQRDATLASAATIVHWTALVFALVSIVSGLTDWNETQGNERRLGILHGVLMAVITVGYVISLVQRIQGDAQSAAYVALAMFVLLVVASHLGGEMAYGFGTGVTRHAWAIISDKWQALAVPAATLEDRKPVRANMKNGFAVMVVKMDGQIHAMAAVCTHAGGPLDKGMFVGKDRRDVRCPWHMSVFSVERGTALHGPATMDEPTFDTRVTGDGNVEVRVRGPRSAKEKTPVAPSSAASGWG